MNAAGVLAPLVLAVAGCGLVSFDIDEHIPEQVVQGSPLGGLLPLGLFQVPLQVDFAQKTRARGTGPASAAYLDSISLSITAPAGQTFEFVDSITIKISADGLPEREVARLSMRQSTPKINLQIVPGVDILPYAEKGSLMTASATGRMPRQETRFDGKVVITVKI